MKFSLLSLFALTLNAAVVPRVENVDKRAFANQLGPKFNPVEKFDKFGSDKNRSKKKYYCNGLLGLRYWTTDVEGCGCKKGCTYHYRR